MNLRANPFRAFPILVAFFLNVVIGPLAPITQLASAPVMALSGSSFDATDGNFVVNGSETDWCSAGLAVTTKNDLPTGQNDDSYAEGAKESDVNPPVETGSIPNNKVDLTRMYVAGETGAGGDLFVYVGWLRSDDNGTGTISFEMNQSGVIQSNGANPERTAGDLLITFNFHGGAFESLTVREWDGSDWGDETDLVSTGLGEGSVNSSAIVDCNGANVPALHFGEFSFNLTDLVGGDCRAFANIFAKSRASNSIESKLKELMKPAGIDLSTCGQITILKEDANGDPLGGATFTIDPNPFTGSGTLDVTDNEAPDDNDDDGVIHLSDVEPGDYAVSEKKAPDGYILDGHDQTLTVEINGSAEFGPWVNGLGRISWQKVDEQSGDKVCCASFTLVGDGGAADGFSLNVTDNGQNDEDSDPGKLLVSGLLLGHYTITEVTPPNGYELPNPASLGVNLNGESASPQGAFQDPPRRDPSVEKTAVHDPVVAGHDASFDIVVTAGGVGDSENVVLSDDNPADSGRTWTVSGPDSGDCDDLSIAPGESLSCDFGTIKNGHTRTVRITMTALQSDCANGIANTATITADDDVDLTNNESSAHISVLCPNPGVVKTANADPIVFGDPAKFTIVVSAGGSGDATGVVLTDENTTDHTWAVGGANAGACDSDSVALGETLTCDFGTIPAGQSRTVTITAISTADDCEEGIANTATIVADDDVDTSNNESGDHITVLCPSPGVEKTANLSPINAGDPASFTIVVTASGSGASENVVLSDENPAGSGHTWAVSGANANACADLSIAPGETLSCDFGTVPNNQSRTVTITMTSNPDDCANGIANTATIAADADVDESDNTSSDHITVECPDVEVTKTGSGTVNATDAIYFEITIGNIGDGDAHGFTFTDTLPAVANGWTLVQPAEAGCSLVGNALTCAKDVFAAGDEFTLRVEADSEVADCGELMNLASASAENEAKDLLSNNSDGHTIPVHCPALTASKDADSLVVSAGQPIGFTISVGNSGIAGTGTAYDVELDDLLPFKAGGTVDWEIDPAYAGPGTCEITGALGSEVLHCEFGHLQPGASASVHVVSDTTKADCQLFHNVGDITSTNHEELMPSADATVECPGLNIIKRQVDANGDPTTDPIVAGETAYFEVIVWNAGPGTALDATSHDELPSDVDWSLDLLNPDGNDSCSVASSVVPGQPESWSADCSFGDLPATSMENGKHLFFSGETDRGDCGLLVNNASAEAGNADEVTASASITVRCPTVEIVKVNDQPDPVLPGTLVHYSLTVTAGDGPADDVLVTDTLPQGLDAPTDISDGGIYDAPTRTITWDLGDLDSGSLELTYQAAVSLDTEQGDELVNLAVVTSPTSQCPNLQDLADECDDDSTVTVRVPELVIDKSADTDEVHFVFDSDGNVLSVDPEQVTWTLTYTLTNGPVTDAVITDPLPEFLVFVSASDGGAYDPATGIITWELGDLTVDGSGSISFVTTVDPAAPETDPILNVATIASNETAPDDGEDSIIVTSESELGGNPTPTPSVPNTALVYGPAGEPISIPVELLAFLLIGSLGTLAYANVRSSRRRR